MKQLKSLFVVLAAASLTAPLIAAGSSDQIIDNNVNMDEIRESIEHLDTDIEKFQRAVELGAEPDQSGLIEFDEPIEYQLVDGEFMPITGIIDPDYVDSGSLFASEALPPESSGGGFSIQSRITCTDNPGYTWVSNSRANVCWAFPGGETSRYPVNRICTNLYGGIQAGTYYYNNAGVPRLSPYRGGTGCYNFTSTVPAYAVTYRRT